MKRHVVGHWFIGRRIVFKLHCGHAESRKWSAAGERPRELKCGRCTSIVEGTRDWTQTGQDAWYYETLHPETNMPVRHELTEAEMQKQADELRGSCAQSWWRLA